jgi:tetratricopeptide (TPR) repeat protein
MRSLPIRLMLTALLAVGAFACKSDEEKLAAHMARGDRYREAEQYSEAIIEYKNVLQIDPNSGEGHWRLSQAYFAAGKPREGFWELRETVRLDDKNLDAKLQFAQLSIIAGEIEEALKQAEEVIAADPDQELAYALKGQAHQHLKQVDEAEAAYRKAVEVAPDSRVALTVLASFLRDRGDRDEAAPLFEKAAKAEPSFVSYSTLGSFYASDLDRTQDAEAEAAFKRALELAEPDELPRGYSFLGSFYYGRDRVDEAIATLEDGIEHVEDPLDLIYLLARIYELQGDDEKADELAERATERVPNKARPYLVLSTHRGRQGDYQGALEAAQKAVDVEPDNREARLRKAEVLVEIGYRQKDDARVAEGRQVVDSVLQEEPTNPAALFVKAKIDLAEKRNEDAVTALRAAIDARPDWAEAHFLLGTALALTGERTAARTELARALEIDASLDEARRVLVEVHAALGEHDYAVEEGRRYLRNHPEALQTRLRVAQSLVLLGQLDDALGEIQKIDLAEPNVDVEYALGRIYTAKGDLDASRTHLLAALEIEPTHPEILRALLRLDRRRGDYAESSARLKKALAEKPDDARLQQLAGVLALAEGRGKDAEAAFKRSVELAPDDISGYRQLAQFYAATGRTGETIRTYERALEVRPNQPQIHHFLGVLYEYGGQRDKAIEHYEAAIRYAPNLAESKNNLAYIYAESGDNLDRALDLAQEAKALLPDDPNTADTLGWVLYKRGVPSAAIGYLKEAEAGMKPGDPNSGVIRHHLAMAYEATGDEESARTTLDRAIEEQDSLMESQRARGDDVGPPPPWYDEALSMRTRLAGS